MMTKKQLAENLRRLAAEMLELAAAMDVYAATNPGFRVYSSELITASLIAKQAVMFIEES